MPSARKTKSGKEKPKIFVTQKPALGRGLGLRIRIRFWAKMPPRTQANLEALLAVAGVYRQPSAALWKS